MATRPRAIARAGLAPPPRRAARRRPAPPRPHLESLGTVGAQHHAAKLDPAADEARMARDRGAARTVEHGQKRAFGAERVMRWRRPVSGEPFEGAPVVGPRGDPDRALPDRRQKFLDVEQRGRAMGEAEPFQACEGEQGRVDLAAFGLAQPRLDIAAQQSDLQIRPQAFDLGLPAQRGRAEGAHARQSREGRRAGGDQRVPNVLAREIAGDENARGSVLLNFMASM